MNTIKVPNEKFNEKHILQTLKSAIEVSKKTLMGDGVLLIAWGLTLVTGSLWNYYKSIQLTAWWMRNLFDLLQIIMGVGVVALTLYFIFIKNRKVRTHAASSTQFLWIGVIIAHNLNVIVTKNFFPEINFVLIQPLQMILVGFALFVMGGIYRYYLLSAVSVIMWTGAVIAANYELNTQFLVRGICDVVCFIIPGVLMYVSSKKA